MGGPQQQGAIARHRREGGPGRAIGRVLPRPIAGLRGDGDTGQAASINLGTAQEGRDRRRDRGVLVGRSDGARGSDQWRVVDRRHRLLELQAVAGKCRPAAIGRGIGPVARCPGGLVPGTVGQRRGATVLSVRHIPDLVGGAQQQGSPSADRPDRRPGCSAVDAIGPTADTGRPGDGDATGGAVAIGHGQKTRNRVGNRRIVFGDRGPGRVGAGQRGGVVEVGDAQAGRPGVGGERRGGAIDRRVGGIPGSARGLIPGPEGQGGRFNRRAVGRVAHMVGRAQQQGGIDRNRRESGPGGAVE